MKGGIQRVRRTLFYGALLLLLVIFQVTVAGAEGIRKVSVSYTVEVKEVPQGAERVRVWVPYPPEEEAQRLLSMEIRSPAPFTINYEPEWGNRIVYFEPGPVPFTFRMDFVVERREIRRKVTALDDGMVERRSFEQYLSPSRYMVHSPQVERFSRMAVGEARTTGDKARKIYDFVLENMEYNKKIPGWGRGDVNRVCLAISGGKKGTGNCTDFHSFFASLMHTQDIPVVFEMGFPLKPGVRGPVEVKGGYHCWARFFVPGKGWVPVDISEADRYPSKKDYFFGSVCENRILFSRGRDILLNPAQKGERLNFFGPDPYIEIDNQPFGGFTRKIVYRDVD